MNQPFFYFYWVKIKISIQIIELEANNFHLITTSTFEDGTSGNWVIDTGASKTVFDKNEVAYYQISGEDEEILSAGISEQQLKSAMATLKPLQFGKLNIQELNVALLDLSHINNLYLKETKMKICGLIGGDFLMKHKAEINYNKKVLVLNF